MTDKLLIDRELLEQICVELEHDNDRYMLGRELRKALALPAAPADGEAVEEAKVVSYLSACTDGYDPDAPPSRAARTAYDRRPSQANRRPA